ncbi:MAG: DUF1700 domain-containing protein [Lachnospiraceae bacterium]|nr:DUF1700 domain-containing protein [Lachnospiraceae bacterium]
MNKADYIKTIEKALVGHVSAQELQDTVTYYRDYIDMEIRKGRTEEEVLESLGNPRLLAKSIITARQEKENVEHESVKQSAWQEREKQTSGFRIPLPVLILIIFLFLGMIIGVLFSIARFLMPILLPVFLVIGVISMLKRWKR